jgi:23S rRNA pseudouridine1911/1915/1917 synthase
VQALAAFDRQALHAERLTFTHPKSGKRVEFKAPIPPDLAGLLGVLDKDMREAAR